MGSQQWCNAAWRRNLRPKHSCNHVVRLRKLIHHRLALRWHSPALLVGRGWTLRKNADESQKSKHDTICGIISSTRHMRSARVSRDGAARKSKWSAKNPPTPSAWTP